MKTCSTYAWTKRSRGYPSFPSAALIFLNGQRSRINRRSSRLPRGGGSNHPSSGWLCCFLTSRTSCSFRAPQASFIWKRISLRHPYRSTKMFLPSLMPTTPKPFKSLTEIKDKIHETHDGTVNKSPAYWQGHHL